MELLGRGFRHQQNGTWISHVPEDDRVYETQEALWLIGLRLTKRDEMPDPSRLENEKRWDDYYKWYLTGDVLGRQLNTQLYLDLINEYRSDLVKQWEGIADIDLARRHIKVLSLRRQKDEIRGILKAHRVDRRMMYDSEYMNEKTYRQLADLCMKSETSDE